MKYFTKQLYQKYQFVEGMTPEEKEIFQDEGECVWNKILQEYQTHLATISKSLANSIQKFLKYEFHDSVINTVLHNKEDNSLCIELNTQHIAWLEGSLYRLKFFRVNFSDGLNMAKGAYWLYDEIHLSEHFAFELHVLCQAPKLQVFEFQIMADELQIEWDA